MLTSGKNGKAHVLEISNRATIQEINNTTLIGIRDNLNNHIASSNPAAHTIDNVAGLQTALNGKADSSHTHPISDVTGLQSALDNKQDTISGATGTVTYIKTVNFTGQTVTTGTINISNGIITSIS